MSTRHRISSKWASCDLRIVPGLGVRSMALADLLTDESVVLCRSMGDEALIFVLLRAVTGGEGELNVEDASDSSSDDDMGEWIEGNGVPWCCLVVFFLKWKEGAVCFLKIKCFCDVASNVNPYT